MWLGDPDITLLAALRPPPDGESLFGAVVRKSLVNTGLHHIDLLFGLPEHANTSPFDVFALFVKARLDPQWLTAKVIRVVVAGAASSAGFAFPFLLGELVGNLYAELHPADRWKTATVHATQLTDIGLEARDGSVESPITRAFMVEEAQYGAHRLTAPNESSDEAGGRPLVPFVVPLHAHRGSSPWPSQHVFLQSWTLGSMRSPQPSTGPRTRS
ncbi:hypothetical protein LUW74_46185 [Actinomadura madurae]|uniref:hypothetical protein n=1 Tax=Actinomadura madurae TaxID=1993 RepID=UPI00202627C6|nr:hypothetical protein [Actinomadura madurae]URN10022.1 hypothetical protein LUW74_46185 [Actinomadura madurae]